MKKILALTLAAVMISVFAACGSKSGTDSSSALPVSSQDASVISSEEVSSVSAATPTLPDFNTAVKKETISDGSIYLFEKSFAVGGPYDDTSGIIMYILWDYSGEAPMESIFLFSDDASTLSTLKATYDAMEGITSEISDNCITVTMTQELSDTDYAAMGSPATAEDCYNYYRDVLKSNT